MIRRSFKNVLKEKKICDAPNFKIIGLKAHTKAKENIYTTYNNQR